MDLRLIPEFDGSGSAPVGEWWEKAELVCKLREVKHLEKVIPLRLTGGAFAVYQQLSNETKADAAKIKEELLSAFAQDSFLAYEQFVGRKLRPGEAADVYLADLRRLSALFGGVSDKALSCAFVAGLPDSVRQILRAGSRMDSLSLDQLLTRARSIMADEGYGAAAAAVWRGACADGRQSVGTALAGTRGSRAPAPPPHRGGGGGGGPLQSAESQGRGTTAPSQRGAVGGGPLCFVCNGPNHLARDCLLRRRNVNGGQRAPVRCYRCGTGGHTAATCPGNDAGEGSAPASSPDCR